MRAKSIAESYENIKKQNLVGLLLCVLQYALRSRKIRVGYRLSSWPCNFVAFGSCRQGYLCCVWSDQEMFLIHCVFACWAWMSTFPHRRAEAICDSAQNRMHSGRGRHRHRRDGREQRSANTYAKNWDTAINLQISRLHACFMTNDDGANAGVLASSFIGVRRYLRHELIQLNIVYVTRT